MVLYPIQEPNLPLNFCAEIRLCCLTDTHKGLKAWCNVPSNRDENKSYNELDMTAAT